MLTFADNMRLKPKKLDIFIAKQFSLLFIAAFLITQFVLMMQFMWRYTDELIGKGLSMEILAHFFWYMGLMLVPQALPLALLLAGLITFGNLGESSELTAIKSAGISLMQAFRSLIIIAVLVSCGSFYFQNKVGPDANLKLFQLLISMRQASPELDIPEGIFYDGIPESNIFVQKKDMKTGKLYGITIYRMTGSYEDQAIIMADSGMLQATADKKHLLLSLWSGEWFENMQPQDLGDKASIPYRRETFADKSILIDYEGNFNMTDASLLSNDARGKSLTKIFHDMDSLKAQQDSIGRALFADMTRRMYNSYTPSIKPASAVKTKKADLNIDTLYAHFDQEKKKSIMIDSRMDIDNAKTDLSFRAEYSKDMDKIIRQHEMQAIQKFTLALSCFIFFFIGAPLGAIIRKGGLGLPFVIAVLVFILFYILDNTGARMVKIGSWNLWFGGLLSTMVLAPIAIFVTYKANRDSAVFNMDAYKEVFKRLLGLRTERHIFRKEVIITDPDYEKDAITMQNLNEEIDHYTQAHHLRHLPSVIKVFFKYEPDHEIERLNDALEEMIEDLSNTRDRLILTEINNYPVLAVKAHTRPFEKKWKNITSAIIFPVGIFLYFRMGRFRLRLYRDLMTIKHVNKKISKRIKMGVES